MRHQHGTTQYEHVIAGERRLLDSRYAIVDGGAPHGPVIIGEFFNRPDAQGPTEWVSIGVPVSVSP